MIFVWLAACEKPPDYITGHWSGYLQPQQIPLQLILFDNEGIVTGTLFLSDNDTKQVSGASYKNKVTVKAYYPTSGVVLKLSGTVEGCVMTGNLQYIVMDTIRKTDRFVLEKQ